MTDLTRDSVCAVVVTYNPSAVLLDNLSALRPQVADLVIVDNGSGPDAVHMLETACFTSSCDLILNGSNLGIAKALNLGIAFARSRGCQHAAFFDQDSKVGDSKYIASLLEAHQKSNQSLRVAMVVPACIDQTSGASLPVARRRDGSLISAMTSGSLVPLTIFDALGEHDERLFIDYVDIEFCLRCRQQGYRIIEAPRALLHHTLGCPATHRLFGRQFVTTNHSASRRYYITRNRLLTMRRYWKDWQWMFYELKLSLSELLKITFVEENPKDKLLHAKSGIADALKNRTGPRVHT